MLDRIRVSRFWVLALALTACALLAVLLRERGWYVADARFEQYWASSQYLSRHRSIWDGVRGLGRPSAYFAPAVAALATMFHAVGASPWLAERLTHATYLAIGGIGMVQVVRLFRPRIGVEHVVAALFFQFSPFTTQFLVPSGLFLHYAICPWLLVAFVRGVRERDSWRWAAAFAVAVFSVGALNPASLVYAASPLVPATAYLTLVERSARWSDVARWIAKAGLLCLGVCAAALTSLFSNAAAVVENLATTELPSTVSRQSSWAESWRGLGSWLTYFRGPLGLLRPQSSGYFTHWWVVLLSFAAPGAALAALWLSRWRARLFFAATALFALLLMVGLYPVGHWAPIGRLEDFAYTHTLLLRSFRNGYKAGGGLAIGIGALLGIGVVEARRRARGMGLGFARVRLSLWHLVAVGGVAVIGLAAYPFWSGQLYSRADRMKAVPTYWRRALTWLDTQPGAGRVLVLPGSTRTRYRWGYAGDDIFDALLHRPHVVRQALSQGTPDAANAVVALNDASDDQQYRQGSLAPVARRLGIRWVVIRNDLAWETSGAPRPADLTGLRLDPELTLAASFGSKGENVAGRGDTTPAAQAERRLPPVEIYAVRNGVAPTHVAAPAPPVVVSGDGQVLPTLAADGVLTGTGPVVYTGDLSEGGLVSALRSGASLYISDTNRRRVTEVTTEGNLASHTLAAGESLTRSPQTLFNAPGTETVATFGDASRITASRYGPLFGAFATANRPASAFDGDPATAWLVGGQDQTAGNWIRVTFKKPRLVSEVDLSTADLPGANRRITRASVLLSSGARIPADVSAGSAVVAFRARRTSFVEVRIDAVSGFGGGQVGFSEIGIPGVHVAESIQVPDDVFRLARSSAARALLAKAPITYVFDRVTAAPGGSDEELPLRRSFRTDSAREFALTGTVSVDASTPDRALDAIGGTERGAYGSDRAGPGINRGGSAVDGDYGTGWETPPLVGERLTLRFPKKTVDHVDLFPIRRGTGGEGGGVSRIATLKVTAGDPESGPSSSASFAPDAPCEPVKARNGDCVQHARVSLPPTATDTITVEVTGVDAQSSALGSPPVRIAEVSIGDAPFALPAPAADASTCRDLLQIDGRPVGIRLSGPLDLLYAGRTLSYASCEPVPLATGWHTLTTVPAADGLVDTARLSAGAPTAVGGGTESIRSDVVASSPTSLTMRVHAPQGGYLIGGQAFARGWHAWVDGRALGAAQPLDTMSGWRLPPAGDVSVSIRYVPQRTYEGALAVTGTTLFICLWLIVRRRAKAGAA